MRGVGKVLRCATERLGRADQIRLVRGQEIEHGAEHALIAKARPQVRGGKPGQRQQALGAGFAFQEPGERAERQRVRIGGG